MKKVFLFIIGFIMFFSMGFMVNAAPYLVCGPQTGVEVYILDIDGTETGEIAAEVDGSIHYDVGALANMGNHVIKAKVGNIWGWSDYSIPFSFDANAPGVPSGFGFSAE